jgi:hypothetical protein
MFLRANDFGSFVYTGATTLPFITSLPQRQPVN